MDKINYSLAPSGATHEYHGMWRKVENGLWRHWNGSTWDICAPARVSDYTPIPEREQALNWLADEYLLSGGANSHSISDEEVKRRRADRIEAGLVEVDNPTTSSLTNSQAKEMELDMLKQNNDLADVNGTKPQECRPQVGDTVILKQGVLLCDHTESRSGFYIPKGGEARYCGEFDYGYGPVAVISEGRLNNHAATIVFDLLEPIKNAEQIADEKREDWARRLCDLVSEAISISDARNVYDALLSCELEAPKGGL